MDTQLEQAIESLKKSEYALLFTVSNGGEALTTNYVRPRTHEGDAFFTQLLVHALRYIRGTLGI